MAETCNVAFGRYLRTLRKRGGLTLDGVCSLSQTFADPINKGYLSRCENGHQRVAFSKIIALSRIYKVPSDVLIERIELDLELDRVGGPETEGLSYAELATQGRKQGHDGMRWAAYAMKRDAVARAAIDPVRPDVRDRDEQVLIAQMICGSAAHALGRHRFPLHEFEYVRSTELLGSRHRPVLFERIAQCHRSMNNVDAAEEAAAQAMAAAEECGDPTPLAYALAIRAILTYERQELPVAIDLLRSAYKGFQDAGDRYECAVCLNNLAQVYFDLRRYRASRRSLEAAERIARPQGMKRVLALGRILLGEIEVIEDRLRLATTYWKEAVSLAKDLNDKVLRFKAEFLLFKQAREEGNAAVARALGRRLLRLSAWLPHNVPELTEFKRIAS